MAVRPVARPGEGSGTRIGLIVAVILAVAFLGLFIWQLTANKQLEDAANSAERKTRQAGQAPQYYVDESTSRGQPVFAVMESDFRDVATLVAGKPEARRPALQEAAQQVLKAVAGRHTGATTEADTLLTAIINLDRALTAEKDKAATLTEENKKLTDEREQLVLDVQATRDASAKEIADLRQTVESLSQDKTESLKEKDDQVARLQSSLESANNELASYKVRLADEARNHEIAYTKLQNSNKDLQDQLQQLKPSSFDRNDILTKADGKVARAVPGSDVVFINLGAGENVKPGMGFEVFSKSGDSFNDYRGKASLEITAVLETVSECRVTRQAPGRPVVEGDLVTNIAYERGRKPRFVIRGEFDLDYDGIVDITGAETVAGLVSEWGGEVVPDVNETTDFLVIGVTPQVSSRPRRFSSPIAAEQAKVQELRQTNFRELVDRAVELNVPILTQNQFLFLTGQAGPGAMFR
ncbi:MAG: hypothetical protein KDA32_14020 [Phycisphaerales bacterium]|nr:hypothetical protein [Phycisphaerales bacterium]